MKYQKSRKKDVHYDAESDVLYLGAKRGYEDEYIEIAPGIGAELNKQGKVIGIEIINASKVMRPVSRLLFSMGEQAHRGSALAAR